MPAVNINMYIKAPDVPLWNVETSYNTPPADLIETAARIRTTPRNNMSACSALQEPVYYVYIAETPGNIGRQMGYVYIPENYEIDTEHMYVVSMGAWTLWQNVNYRFRRLQNPVLFNDSWYTVYEFAQLNEDNEWEGLASRTQFCFQLNSLQNG